MQHFVVIAMGRSESSRLCDIPGRHPSVACHQEIFSPHEVQAHLPKDLGLKLLDREFRDSDSKAFLDEFLRFNETWFKDRQWHGFKTILGPRQMRATLLCCADRRLRKILLHRDNLLAGYVSHRLGVEAGIWHRLEGGEPVTADYKIHFDRRQFQSYCGLNLVTRAACERALRQSGQTFLTVEYQESLTQQGMNRIWSYLELPAIDDEGIRRRTNTQRLIDCLVNPDEAAEAVLWLGRPDWLDGTSSGDAAYPRSDSTGHFY